MGDYAKALADFEAIEGLGYALYSPSNGVKGNRDFFQLFKRVVLLGTIIFRILLLWKCTSVRMAPNLIGKNIVPDGIR